MRQLFVHRHTLVQLCLTLLVLLTASTAFAALTSSVDRNQMNGDETVTLTVTLDDAGFSGDPDLAGLDSNFEILNSGSSSNTMISNGSITSKKTWRYTLAPKHTGKLLVPSFRLGKEFSEAVEIEVLSAGSNNTDNNTAAAHEQHGDLFVDMKTDKDEAYVQERITLTVRIYSAIQIDAQHTQIPDPVIPGMMIEKLGQSEYQAHQDNRNYHVYEIRYSLFANQSGTITVPKQRYQIIQVTGSRSVFDIPGFGVPALVERTLTTPATDLHIKPQPATAPGNGWLPSDNVQINDNWPEQQTLDTGTPLTRTIEIRALGNLSSQIPPLPAVTLDGLKSYPAQPELKNEQAGNNVLALRKESTAFVPTQPGTYVLPAIEIHWWDTKNREFKIATLGARTLTVRGAAASASTTPLAPMASSTAPANPDADAAIINPSAGASPAPTPFYLNSYLWIGVAALLLVLWVITTVLLLRKKTSAASNASTDSGLPSSLKEALKQLKLACQKNDARQARAALILWAQQQWPDAHIHTLADVKTRINQPNFATLADELDSCLYRENVAWNGKPLADFMQMAKFSGVAAKADVKLPNLYS